MTNSSLLAVSVFSKGHSGIELIICWFGVLYAFTILVVGWGVRSWRAALTSALAAFAIGFFFTPWTSLSKVGADDPNVMEWLPHFRIMAIGWLFASTCSILSMPAIWWMDRKDKFQRKRVSRRAN